MRGCGHKDEELTKLRVELGIYEDKDSYVSVGSREFLFGEDKKKRYRECWERDNHRCVECMKLLAFEEMHPHHKKERGKGGDDALANLETRCAEHHIGPKGMHA